MKTYNIPIFVPHRGCPFDCVFCNQKRITGVGGEVTPDDVRRIIEEHLQTLPNGAYIEAAFFGGSFTGIPIEEQSALMAAAGDYIKSGAIAGIRLSTRPDYIDECILDNLLKHGVTTIELGVQSMNDEVLFKSGRGHTAARVREAAELIGRYPFTLGLQMMTGLPGDTPERSLYTAEELIRLRPKIVRIYPTLTIRDTALADMYRDGTYRPQTVDEAVELCKRLVLKFEANDIKVIRVGLQSTDEICENGSVVAGPVHSAFGELVESAIYYDLITEALSGISDGIAAGTAVGAATVAAAVAVHPREISKAVGNKRMNIDKIRRDKNIRLKIIGDENMKKREVRYICF